MIRIGAASAFLGAKASDPVNMPDLGIAEVLTGSFQDIEDVIREIEDWRKNRLGVGR